MHTGDATPNPARPAPRRVAWGTLLTDAPWDGRPRAAAAATPAPSVAAGRATPDLYAPGSGTPRSRRRVPLGALLANVPWAARPLPVAPAAAPEPGRLVVTA